MKIMVIDVGNTHLKCDIWHVADGIDNKLLYSNHNRTSRHMPDNLELIRTYYNHNEKDAVIILSMGDSVVYETVPGKIEWLPYDTQTHEYAHNIDLPPFAESGVPRGQDLQGSFQQIMMLRLRPDVKRILPMSAFIAAWLAEYHDFANWDITQASNSGLYNYQTGKWQDCIGEFLRKGIIGEKIDKSNRMLIDPYGIPIFIGGHDSTFANATDLPYSTKPYVSCGTWTTVSVENKLSRNWRDRGQRYVIAPNGTILEQLCFKSESKLETAKRIIDFLDKKFAGIEKRPIGVFGTWRKDLQSILAMERSYLEFTILPENYLTECAARYAAQTIRSK